MQTATMSKVSSSDGNSVVVLRSTRWAKAFRSQGLYRRWSHIDLSIIECRLRGSGPS
jgi:hypothetical protein